MKKKLAVIFLVLLQAMSAVAQTTSKFTQDVPSVGVFYFPGWHENARGLLFNPPWEPIKKYADREPMLGWYDDASIEVLRQQEAWMRAYGVDYVVFDWYWDGTKPFLEQSLNAYMSLSAKLPFSLMWANHDAEPRNKKSFGDMVSYWITTYFSDKAYLKLDGMPVVYIFSGDALEKKAKEADVSVEELLNIAQQKAKVAGLKGIFFVVGTQANTLAAKSAKDVGYSAYFAYNYHAGKDGLTDGQPRNTHSFAELTDAYKTHWDWFGKNAPLPYFLPVTAGWDKRPWGGSQDSRHDGSVSTPAQFGRQLEDAVAQSRVGARSNINSILVCCWNEYGEGSVVEPTKRFGFQYLQEIRKVSPGFQVLDR